MRTGLMCGKAGAFGADRPDAGRIKLTLQRMRNRGPDAQGVHSEQVGSRQLNTIGLTGKDRCYLAVSLQRYDVNESPDYRWCWLHW